jgi:hypothetical protein
MVKKERLGKVIGIESQGAPGAQGRFSRLRPVDPVVPELDPSGYKTRADKGLPPKETQRQPALNTPVEPIKPVGGILVLPSEERRGHFNPEDWRRIRRK